MSAAPVRDTRKIVVYSVFGVLLLVFVAYAYNSFFGGSPNPAATAPVPSPATTHPSGSVEEEPEATIVPAGNARASQASAPGIAAKRMASTSSSLDPTLDETAMLRTESLMYSGSGRNIFSPVSAPAIEIPRNVPTARPGVVLPVLPPMPVGPPPPPPINLKYFGTAVRVHGKRQAFLLQGEDVYLAAEGDIVARKYRIVSISATNIQVEDLVNQDTQTLPLMGVDRRQQTVSRARKGNSLTKAGFQRFGFMKRLFGRDGEAGSCGREGAGEEGFMLLAVVVMVALVLIALAVAAPVVARQLQRDKEIESQHRMQQYVRAVQLYQRKFPGQYPASIKILENTNNLRFLRHVYVDPLTGKADYKLIHLGEQKTKIHVFFGQELAGLAANLGAAAGMQSAGGVGTGAGAGATSATNVTSTNALNSGFGGATIGGSSGTSGTTGATGTSSSSDSSVGSLGVIVGVGTSKSGTSITQPNQQTSYEAWEFWYDPRIEVLKQGVNVTGGGMTGGAPGSGMGSQSASSFGQSGTSGQLNSGAASGPGNSSNTFGGTSSGTANPNSSTPNPF